MFADTDSLVKYEGNTVSLEHGAVKVATTQGISIRAGEVAVQPANANDATDFDVSDVDGTVHIAARKGDVWVLLQGDDPASPVDP